MKRKQRKVQSKSKKNNIMNKIITNNTEILMKSNAESDKENIISDNIENGIMICNVNTFLDKLNSNYLDELCKMFIGQWKNDKKPISICYINNNQIVSFALLSRMDFDPHKKHINPHCINYIYTFDNQRNMGYASKLLQYIKIYYQTSAFCSNKKSILLFKKNGYTNYNSDENISLFRYP